jgi:hypothetical protein
VDLFAAANKSTDLPRRNLKLSTGLSRRRLSIAAKDLRLMRVPVLSALLGSTLAGCDAPTAAAPQQSGGPKVYVTGSRIARPVDTPPADVQDVGGVDITVHKAGAGIRGN